MRLPRPFVLLLGLVLSLMLPACGRLPTAPYDSGTLAPTTQPAAITLAKLRPNVNPDEGPTPLVVSERIDGTRGAVLIAGRFTLVVPPGASHGQVVVTMELPDPSQPICDLRIAPASANGFLIPVTLTADCRDLLGVGTPQTFAIAWFDPEAGVWRPVPGSVMNGRTRTVHAPLSQFSRCGVIQTADDGRAGW